MAYRQLQATPIPPGSIIYTLFVLILQLNETRVRAVLGLLLVLFPVLPYLALHPRA